MSDRPRTYIERVIREPAVHFLLLGAVLFGLYALVRPTPDTRRIEISDAMVESLRQDHVRRTGQQPTAVEETALIEQLVDDEVLFREALALGLDRGDPVVRRRLIQKMRFLTEDLAPLPEPEAAELEQYLSEHAESYYQPDQLAIQHVFVNAADGAEAAEARAESLLGDLQSGVDPSGLGDPFLHGYTFSERSSDALDGRFGPGFSAALATAQMGVWIGPVTSSYGLHLVRINSRRPARLPELEDVEAVVRRDWTEERRAEVNREGFARLRAQYEIVVEPRSGRPDSQLAEPMSGDLADESSGDSLVEP